MEKQPIDDYEDEQEETLATPGVIDKYQQAGKIANAVLEKVLAKIVPGAKLVEITAFGDNEITEELKKVYAKKKIEKGIAFPTCLSVNEIVGHYSPLVSDAEDKEKQYAELKEGDVVKVDLGVHIDGYIALVAHTKVAQAQNKPVEGRAADVILAAYNAIQAAFRCLKPGKKNNDITPLITKISESYGCQPVEGVLSHDLKKHLIDGNNVIINKETFEQKVEDYEFNINDVFALDVIISTGEGKPKESELRTTVYKRAIEKTYNLKTKNARAFFYELIDKYPSLAFSCRSFQDEITTKLGVSECLKHDLLNPYPVLVEKAGEIVAHFKITCLILQGGVLQITGFPIDEAQFKTDKTIQDEEVKALLSTKMDKDSQKKDKKKKKKEGGEEAKKE